MKKKVVTIISYWYKSIKPVLKNIYKYYKEQVVQSLIN